MYTMRRYHAGRRAGNVRVEAHGPLEAFERVRSKRPEYERDTLVLFRIEDKEPKQ